MSLPLPFTTGLFICHAHDARAQTSCAARNPVHRHRSQKRHDHCATAKSNGHNGLLSITPGRAGASIFFQTTQHVFALYNMSALAKMLCEAVLRNQDNCYYSRW
jgi:hypothetical protein